MQSLWMLAAAFLFSLMAVCTKLGAEHFSTFELVFYRSLFGMIVIALWVLLKRQTLRTQFFFSHMKRSFFGTLGLTIWFWTLGVLPLGTSMTLNYTSPLYM
ncbi:MAG: EamA/RhaT family transporter, partial [Sutterella sp.]|nr:EamA/RhaT family transporter [Sutterella sp.]